MADELGSKVKIRQCIHEDFVLMAKVANEVEHWNESLVDLELWNKCSPGGSFAALLDGKPVGFCIAFNWNDKESFGGMSVVLPGYRGKGIGKAVWAERRKYFGDRNFGVVAVAQRKEPNIRIGFKYVSERVGLYMGKIDFNKLQISNLDDSIKIVPFSQELLDKVAYYDESVCKLYSRKFFLKEWFAKPNTKCLVALQGDKVVGYGCIQPAGDGYRVSPLYAEQSPIAKQLMNDLLTSVPDGSPLCMYVPCHKEATELTEGLGVPLPFEPFIRMSTKHEYNIEWCRAYCSYAAEMTHI